MNALFNLCTVHSGLESKAQEDFYSQASSPPTAGLIPVLYFSSPLYILVLNAMVKGHSLTDFSEYDVFPQVS